MQQVTLSPLADITSLITGTTASWSFEVTAVYVNGVSTSFSWSNGTVSIPSYTVGTVLVEFPLYLLFDAPSQYLPSDPTDMLSDPVFWENRLRNFINFSTSIKSFESGLTEINVGTVAIQLDDDWIQLAQQQLIMPNTIIRIYRDSQIVFKGVATKHTISDYVMNINIQKRITIFDSECHFGDPAYLNRIDRSTNTAYYNGANVPEQFEGAAIPMLFGPEFPYDQSEYTEIDVGPSNPGIFANGTETKFAQKNVSTSSFIVRIIPTSTSTGIIGRMPDFQSLVSSPADLSITASVFDRFYQRSQDIGQSTLFSNTILGEAIILERTSDGKVNIGRTYLQTTSPNATHTFLGIEDASYLRYDMVLDYSTTEHWFTTNIPASSWTLPAVSSGSFTPGGNRWLTANFTGIDLYTNECFVVFTGITGAADNFELMQWIMEQHGFTVDATSFSSLSAEFNVTTIQQVGQGNDMPTLGNLIAEMNQSLMTILVFPADNDEPFVKKIDPTAAASVTLDDSQIARVTVSSEYRNQAANVQFRPKYARSDEYKYSLYRNLEAPNKDLFASQKTFEVSHVLSSLPSSVTDRWEEMTEIYGAPQTTVTFDLFDDDVEIELGDMVQIDHDLFQNKIMILSIDNKQQGRTVQGRYFYVNES